VPCDNIYQGIINIARVCVVTNNDEKPANLNVYLLTTPISPKWSDETYKPKAQVPFSSPWVSPCVTYSGSAVPRGATQGSYHASLWHRYSCAT